MSFTSSAGSAGVGTPAHLGGPAGGARAEGAQGPEGLASSRALGGGGARPDPPPHLEGREDHEDRLLESIVGPPLVARLYGLLRAVRIYDLSNQAVHDQLRET